MRSLSRRAAVAAVVSSVAGCSTRRLGTTTPTDESPSRTTPRSETATPTDTPTPTETATAAPPSQVTGEWRTPGANAGWTGHTRSPGPASAVAAVWAASFDDTVSRPVIADGTLFVTTGAGTVVAVDARTGERVWRRSFDGLTERPPSVWRDRVVVGTRDGVTALAAGDGRTAWRVRTGRPTRLLATEGAVYALVGGDPPAVVSLGRGGERQWRTTLGDPWAPRIFAGGSTVFVSSGTHSPKPWRLDVDTGDANEVPRGYDFPAERFYLDGVYAVDPFFGNLNGPGWTDSVPPAGEGGGALTGGAERVYYTTNADSSRLLALNRSDGSEAWRVETPEVVGRPLVGSRVLLLPTADGVRAYRPADGTELWRDADLSAARGAVADDLLFAAEGTRLRALRPL